MLDCFAFGNQLGRICDLEYAGETVQQGVCFIHQLQHPCAGHGLDPTNAGCDRGFADNLEQADLGSVVHMGSAAELQRISADIHHTDDVAVFFPKQGHCTE